MILPDPILGIPVLALVGLAGALLYMLNFALLTARAISADGVTYFVVNLCAATLVLVSLAQDFNPATLVIQSFFICVSTVGIVSRLARLRATPPAAHRLRPLR